MEKRASSFEDHMEIVQAGHAKTAGSDSKDGNGKAEPSLLDKLATELGMEDGEKTAQVTAPAAPAAEGEVTPAESTVATAAPAVVAATEAVATPQTAIAGGNPAEAAAGEVPAATKTNEGTAISAGDGKVTDANQLHKTPEAVQAAARGGGGDEGGAAAPAPEKSSQVPDNDLTGTKTAEEAQMIGKTIAASFQAELEKNAEDQDYATAVQMLKEGGLLEGYTLKDEGINKTASELPTGCLEKISQKQPLNRKDIIGAAYELVQLEKDAEEAEKQGREDARARVDLLTKVSGDGGSGEAAAAPAEGGEAAAPAAGSEAAAPAEQSAASAETTAPSAGESGGEGEKVATLLQNPDIVKSIRTLRQHGVIN